MGPKNNIDLGNSINNTRKYFIDLHETKKVLRDISLNHLKTIEKLRFASEGFRKQEELLERTMDSLDLKKLSFLNTNEKIYEDLKNVFSFQINTMFSSKTFHLTNEIEVLLKGFAENNYTKAMNDFSKTLEEKNIEAQNLAFLKMNKEISRLISYKMPRGIPTLISNMHVNTADRLAKTKNIKYNKREKVFFDNGKVENVASIQETNIICSGLELLIGLTDTEMIDFMNYMSKHIALASQHPVAAKIDEAIRIWVKKSISRDSYYYHGRYLPIGKCPYTNYEMCAAPNGITWHGRFNFPGESHYYFSDKEKGAINEIKRHIQNAERIQIVKLKPTESLKLVDLSIRNEGSKFLEYCRFPLIQNENFIVRKEYLVPSFVANCCKANNIDGIKYYGSKEYNNYVTWKDGHFSYISHRIV